jgi:ATP-binding cassette, subfamily B, bacterial
VTLRTALQPPHFFAWLKRRRRVSVTLQLNATECGVACLTMILNYHGRETHLAECREQFDAGRDGTTAEMLARAGRYYGLRVNAYTVQHLDALEYVSLPAIAHWGFNHFVVLERWSGSSVEIVDPASGRRRVSPDEFSQNFTGVILTFEPSLHFDKNRAKLPARWRVYAHAIYTQPQVKSLLLQIIGASLLLQLFSLALPLFTKIVVDDVLRLQMTSVMPILGLSMAVLILSQGIANYLRSGLLIYFQTRLDSQLMLGFLEHLLSLPFRFFQQRSSGDLLMRLHSNTTIRELLTGQTISIILDGILVTGYLLVLLAIVPLFALLVLALGGLQMVLILLTTRPIHRLVQQQLLAQAESQAYLVEVLQNVALLKATGAEGEALTWWSGLFAKQLNISLRREHLSAAINSLVATVRVISPLLLLWVGAHYVLNGTLGLGTVLAINAIGLAFIAPLSALITTAQSLQLVRAHLERIADVLEAEPESKVQASPKELTGHLEVRNLSFRYANDGPLILRNISFLAEAGQKIAIVGPTGSGKSTLGLLLLGLYNPQSGHIYYDGIPHTHCNYPQLRRQFGVVLQESMLFNDSVRRNIAFGAPSASLTVVHEAARIAAIDEEIMAMPMGYETPIAEGGGGISGGQRQRLALARSILRRPKILLLDEATSHLDVETERLVNDNLNALHCTRIVIAHRLSTIRDADLILVLDQGTLVEQGTHPQLLRRNGRYAALVASQETGNPSPHLDRRLNRGRLISKSKTNQKKEI